jgi:hypothetical protein
MTDVRRAGPPRRLEDRTRFSVPIEGEVDGIWQRAFHAQIIEETSRQPDLPGSDFFGRSLTINSDHITFYFADDARLLPTYLDMIEGAIAPANETAAEERHRVAAAAAEAEREVHDRDEDMERELTAWAEKQPALA